MLFHVKPPFKLHFKIVTVLLIVALTACSSEKKPDPKPPEAQKDYVTLTYSEYATTENEGDIQTQIMSYDPATKKLEDVFAFDYTAQYPLGFYDRKSQKVYYTQKVGTDTAYGDQIFVRDLAKQETTQLTDHLFAVNYMIASGNQLFFVANVKGEQAIRLGALDLQTKKMKLWGDADMLVEAMTLDAETQKIYVSAYSLKQRNYSLTHQDGPAGQNNFKMPEYTVYETDFALEEKKKLFSKKQWLRMLMNKEGHIIAFGDQEYNKGQIPSTVIDYDLDSEKYAESKWKSKRLQRGEANYSGDARKIYALAILNNERGLVEYDTEADRFTPIFMPKEGFINNMQVVKGQ